MASFAAPRVERDGTSGLITIHPAIGKHSATIVFCHGLGDSGEGFSDVAENMARTMPYCKFILPTANVRPVTLNGGMKMNAWYDIVGLSDRASESCAGIDESVTLVRTLLEGESRLGISFDRMVLAGFSQGGALSLFTGLQVVSASCSGTIQSIFVYSITYIFHFLTLILIVLFPFLTSSSPSLCCFPLHPRCRPTVTIGPTSGRCTCPFWLSPRCIPIHHHQGPGIDPCVALSWIQ